MPWFEHEIHVPRRPEAVRAWWTTFADDWTSPDPKARPFRLVVERREGNRTHLVSHWPGSFGRPVLYPEILTLEPDGSWTFDTKSPYGIDVRDTFRAVADAAGSGARVQIRCELRGRDAAMRAILPLLMPYLKRTFRSAWRAQGEACARET